MSYFLLAAKKTLALGGLLLTQKLPPHVIKQTSITYQVFDNKNWETMPGIDLKFSSVDIGWECNYRKEHGNYPFLVVNAYAQVKFLGVPTKKKILIGSALFEKEDEKGEWELEDIGIEEKYQRNGIGTSLLQIAEAVLRPTKMYAMSVPEAVNFYKKTGFKPLFERTSLNQEEKKEIIKQGLKAEYPELNNLELEKRVAEIIKAAKDEDFETGGFMVKEYPAHYIP